MKILLATTVLFVFNVVAYGQVSISGKVVDKKNKPLEYATIVVKKDSIVMANAFTDSMGNYKIQNMHTGSYNISCSFINDKIEILLDVNKDTMVNIQLNTNKQLEQVTVAGKKPLIERKVDRIIFNVENSVSATGGDALDALKITPSIQVQNDKIKVIGKSDVAVMVDDRVIQLSGDDLIHFLKTMSSDNIKSIEVITNPPAKYDAEGNSGLINIRLKKVKLDSWNASINSSYKQATYPTIGNGVSFNYQKNRFSLFTSINYVNGSKNGVEEEGIMYSAQTWKNEFNRRDYSNVFSSRVGVDYKTSNKLTIGAQYLGSLNKPKTTQNDKTIITKNISHVIDSLITSTSYEYKEINSNAINIHSLIKLDSIGRNVSLDLDYFNLGNNINRNFQTQNRNSNFDPIVNGYKSAENFGLQNINIYSAKVDLVHPLKWIKLTYGGKIYFSKTKYDNKYFDTKTGTSLFQPNQSNNFEYTENTQALYISANKKISDKWELQLGLRVENTQTKGNSLTLRQIDTNNYIQFFPTTYIQYTANKNHSFLLNFGRRLSRPRYNELNPFKVYYNPYSYTQGNPFLSPSFTNNIEFQHIFKDILFTSFSFSNTTGGRGNPPFFDENTKIQYLLDLNYYTFNSYNITETYVFNKFKWWESQNQVNLFYTTTHVTKDINLKDSKGLGAYFSTNNNLILNKSKTIRAEVNFWYQPPQYEGIYKKESMYGVDLGFKISLLKNNLQLTIAAKDILKTDIDKAQTYSGSIRYNYSEYNDTRYCRISLTYKLGSQKLNVKQRNVGNEEEKKRAE